jgi:RNA polymerase sigma factor (TIGR02999 family)
MLYFRLPLAEVTELLTEWRNGDVSALDRLIPLVYQDLRRLAHHMLRARGPEATQGTALVHDLYVRLAGQTHPDIQSRAHFFAVASRGMRQILVDRARRVSAQRRGGGVEAAPLDEARAGEIPDVERLLAIDQALTQLAAMHPRRAQLMELRHFGGLSVDETAETLGVSAETIRREARMAEAWLSKLLA